MLGPSVIKILVKMHLASISSCLYLSAEEDIFNCFISILTQLTNIHVLGKLVSGSLITWLYYLGESEDSPAPSRSRSQTPVVRETHDVDNDIELTKDTLPPYLPAIQGCRSVEEFQCLNRSVIPFITCYIISPLIFKEKW